MCHSITFGASPASITWFDCLTTLCHSDFAFIRNTPEAASLDKGTGAPLTKQGKPLISSSLSSIVILACAYFGYILLIPSWLFVLSVGFSVSTSIALALYYSNPLTRPWLISFLEPCLGRKIAEWKLRTRANESYHQSVTVLDNGTSDGVLQPRIRNKDQQFTRWKRDA